MESCDLFIVGGGAAGLSAARAAAEQGAERILLADCMPGPGGILRQCMHSGFGPGLTGSEFIAALLADYPQNVRFLWNTTVLSVDEGRRAVLASPDFGLKEIGFAQMILAAGCREKTAGSLEIAGTRPKGIFTAGRLQQAMNLHGFLPQGPAVILGSGDVGLVMAWQLIKNGVEIRLLAEKKEKCGGLARSWKRLEGHPLPVRTACTVSRVLGEESLEAVGIRDLHSGAEEIIPCRLLVIAAGLVPERSLISKLAPQPWLHLCGNCRCIHSVVEGVVQEGRQAGIDAYEGLKVQP